MMAELLLEFSPSGYLTDTQPVPLYVDTPQGGVLWGEFDRETQVYGLGTTGDRKSVV